ncbi:phage tail tape measure protein [Streptomyces scabiei]|uniref:Phage-related minor tail protein n=1 Tax=Streptomyces scabiei TaxID=1930 RepID=A0A100JLS2_STRSC|nr:phage tail tape measure protein [Streptomyces scabiei]GAQ61884.1 phage-related minor tail protein [Streptomyces scabiei]
MSDTSLVFALSARDETGPGMREGRETVETETAGMADAAESNGAKMGTALAAAGAAAGAMAAAALMSTLEQALDMSEATTKVEAALANTTADIGAATDAMTNVFTDGWGESAVEVGDAIRSVTLNMDEFTGNQQGLEDMTKKAMALAKVFDDDINKATAAAGQMVKTGMADSFDEAMDLLAAGMGSVANKSQDLLDTFNEYPTQFRRLGLDGATAMGLISQGLKAGARDSDSMADALGIFGEMALAGGEQVDAAFESIGLNGAKIGKQMRAGGDEATQALQDTMDALRGTDDETVRLAASQVLFGDLANTQADALFALDPASAAAAGGFDDVAGAADKVVDKLEDSPAMKMEAFKRGVQQNVIDFLGGEVLPAVESFKQGFEEAFGSIWAEAGAGGAQGADRIVGFFEILGRKLVDKAVEFAPKAVEILSGFGQKMADYAMANPVQVFKIAAIAGALTLALVALPLLVATALGATAFLVILGFVGKLVTATGEALPRWWDSFTGWVSAKAGETGQVFDTVGSAVGGWFSGLWTRYVSGPVGRQWDAWTGSVQALPGRAVTALSSLGTQLAGSASSAGQRFKDAAVAKGAEFIGWMGRLPGRTVAAVGNTGRLLYSKGRDVVTGLWNGIASLGGWLWDKVGDFVSDNVVGAAASLLEIGSPSKRMGDAIGHWIPPGIAEGAEDNRGVLDATMQGLVDPSLAMPTASSLAGAAPLASSGGAGGLLTVRVVLDGPRALTSLIREIVADVGGGSVEKAFGTP